MWKRIFSKGGNHAFLTVEEKILNIEQENQ